MQGMVARQLEDVLTRSGNGSPDPRGACVQVLDCRFHEPDYGWSVGVPGDPPFLTISQHQQLNRQPPVRALPPPVFEEEVLPVELGCRR